MDKLGKIHQHHRKEHLNVSKIAKFENDMSHASECIALKIYRRLYGGGQVCVPTKFLQNFATLRSYIFVSFSTNHFQTKQFY